MSQSCRKQHGMRQESSSLGWDKKAFCPSEQQALMATEPKYGNSTDHHRGHLSLRPPANTPPPLPLGLTGLILKATTPKNNVKKSGHLAMVPGGTRPLLPLKNGQENTYDGRRM